MKCFYCQKEATYNDMSGTEIISVCRKHLAMGLSS
jgi:hypothetical protein